MYKEDLPWKQLVQNLFDLANLIFVLRIMDFYFYFIKRSV